MLAPFNREIGKFNNPYEGVMTKTKFERLLNEQGFPEHETRCKSNYPSIGYGSWLRKKYLEEFNSKWKAACKKSDVDLTNRSTNKRRQENESSYY